MSRHQLGLIRFIAAAACALSAVPALAVGATSGWPVASTDVLLAHGSSYALGEETRTHSGVDISAQRGETVHSGIAGEVTFVGRVPGAAGETVLAVTVLCGDVKFTYLPLSSAEVAKDDEIGAGEAIGSVAEGGDPSSARSHLHVSARRGTMYVDPTALLAAPLAEQGADGDEAASGTSHVEEPDSAEPAPRPKAPATTPSTRPAPAQVGAAPAAAPSGAGAAVPSGAATEPGVQVSATPAAISTALTPSAMGNAAVTGAAGAASGGALGAAPQARGVGRLGAAARRQGVALFGMDTVPAVGLRLPGLAECALGLAASLALRLGLARSSDARPVRVLEPVLAEERG